MEERKSSYQIWLEQEGMPLNKSLAGIEDITTIPRKHWDRIGGNTAFLELEGTRQALRGMYVAEIPGGESLKPEKHLYEEAIYIIEGRGFTEIWQGEGSRQKFEWGPGSFFSIPLNASHRLVSGSRNRVLFFAATSAPRIMSAFAEDDFEVIFNCDYSVKSRWSQRKNYFTPNDKREIESSRTSMKMRTNFIPDVRALFLDDRDWKVSGGQSTGFIMGRYPRGHVSEWPVGRYHAAHYHGPGAILLGLSGEGYALVWPNELGPHPYETGHGDEVLKVNWKEKSIYSPPDRWYHQHFNTGDKPCRHLAIYGTMDDTEYRPESRNYDFLGAYSIREGGTMIQYNEEDPQIRTNFEKELQKKGIKFAMPKERYEKPVVA
jgi:quercetin dioxygenase-like cupin family protein/oxalate decarboxylase/phosphoglucose isomerase-like protein (cupin superfamily)